MSSQRNKKYREEEINDFEDESEEEVNEEEEDDEEDDEENDDENDDDESESEIPDEKIPKLDKKTNERLKRKITEWMDYDDKIKIINNKLKKYKDAKKKQEETVLEMIDKLNIDSTPINIYDDNQNMKGRVYKYKSVTKESIKDATIKEALLEVIRDEKKVDQLIKKIDSRRETKTRYYLKRTKGNKK
jgi:hypothetical protein